MQSVKFYKIKDDNRFINLKQIEEVEIAQDYCFNCYRIILHMVSGRSLTYGNFKTVKEAVDYFHYDLFIGHDE